MRRHPRAADQQRRPPAVAGEEQRLRSPPAIVANPPPMFGMQTVIGGPAMPRSKSRADGSWSASSGSSRWASPGGPSHASSRRSCSQAATPPPRFDDSASCTGPRACIAMKTTPTRESGPPSVAPSCTAATSTPMATANAAGSRPRSAISAHQDVASPGAARRAHRRSATRPSRGGARSPRECLPRIVGHVPDAVAVRHSECVDPEVPP